MIASNIEMLNTGLMHPDLFDGESLLRIPVICPDKPQAWHVWIFNGGFGYRWRRVIACTSDEAEELVDAMLSDRWMWASDAELSYRKITQLELDTYLCKRFDGAVN